MIEELISTDLAALAAHDRQHIGPLVVPQTESEARARFAVPWQAAVTAVVVATSSVVGARTLLPSRYDGPIWYWPTPEPIDPWLVGAVVVALTALAFLVATRIVVRRDPASALSSATGARWAGGVAALLCAVNVWLVIQNPGNVFVAHTWSAYRFMQPALDAVLVAAIVLGAAALGSTWRGPVSSRTPTRLAILLLFAGTSLLVMFGLMWFTNDHWAWRELVLPVQVRYYDQSAWNPQVVVARWAIGGSLAGVIGLTIAIAFACVRERTDERARLLARLEHGSIVPIALALGVAAMTLESMSESDYHALHLGQRIVLTALGTLSVALLVANWSLRQRRRALTQTAVRGTTKLPPWLATAAPIAIAFGTAGVLLQSDLVTFDLAPRLAIVLVLAVMAMFGLAGARPVPAGRPLSDLLAAGLFTAIAVGCCALGWHQHRTDYLVVAGGGGVVGPSHVNPIVTTTQFAVVTWAAVLAVAAVAARWFQWGGGRAWAVSAKVVVVTVLLTWLGLNQYIDRWTEVIAFHAHPLTSHVLWGTATVEAVDPEALRSHWIPAQLNAIEAGLALLGLAVSIGVASSREKARRSRWLAILESPLTIPLGVILATGSLLLAAFQWDLAQVGRGSLDDIPWWATWASIGAVVAYASMLLRRRRREALS